MKEKPYIEIQRTDKMLFICPFCKKEFRALARHTWQVHGVTGKKLRKMFGLKSNYQLITPDLKELHRKVVQRNYDSHVKKNLTVKGKSTRYKKGFEGHTRRKWSKQALYELGQRAKKEKSLKNLMYNKGDSDET